MNLQELFKTGKYPTDKDTTHSYLEIYDDLFSKYRDKEVSMLEIGNNGGASIRLWNDYFENLQVTGVEINAPPELIQLNTECDNVDIHMLTDAYNVATVQSFADKSFDIIIDDGSHLPQHQAFAARFWTHLLKDGGLFVIEDIQNLEYVPHIIDAFPENLKDKAILVDRRHIKDRFDDIMIVVEN